jgi:hypothetical protein
MLLTQTDGWLVELLSHEKLQGLPLAFSIELIVFRVLRQLHVSEGQG